MAFSLFGKKDEPPTKKKTTTRAVEKPGDRAQKPAPPPASAAVLEASPASGDDDFSLDFSHYVPPPPAVKAAPSERPRPPSAPAQKPAAAPQASSQQPAAAAPMMPQAPGATPGARDTAPVIEEAAILFANGQSLQALTALTKAVHDGDLGPSALQVWLMLFDLYQLLGMKAEFEALGMDFLVKFERSPPVWIKAEPQSNPALATGGMGYCALTGVLSDGSASQLEQLRRMSQRQQAIRIDFAKLQGVDPFGCARLLVVLEVLKTSGKEVVFTGEAHLLRLLEAECQTENKDTDGVLWSLQFEILRRLGLEDRFEEAAVNYAVTYEVSPPSWPSRDHQTGAKTGPGPRTTATEPAQPAFRLSGDVTGASENLPRQLEDWAASNSPLVIDMSAVRRVDFVSAGQLLNVFTGLHQAGTTVQIRGANELIAVLFGVMGIGQVARIIQNR